ncbi:MAG: DUF502 domain-containing protein [Sphingobacteriaceae bacterium]|nr:MAG: DUF502 domain-containing protein [Sphingobacteriaceae bacterium]
MNRIFRALVNYFIKGVLVVVPIGAAVYLILWIVASVDKSLNLSDLILTDTKGRPIYIPGLGILTILVVIMLAGVIVTNLITEPIYAWFSRLFHRLPLFNFVYTSIKDLTEAFVGDEKKFNEPVLVTMDEFGLKRIGFVTQKDLTVLGLPDDVAVYFPFSYSFTGQLVIVPATRVKPIDKSASEMMKFVVSGGVSHLD